MRSAVPAKITEWSPTTVPPRNDAKPMSPAQRAPVSPSRPRTERCARLTPRPSAAARPSISAVPDGASIFLLWCISTISMSKSSSSVAATRLASAASRFTPRLILPDFTITARFAASAISFSFSPDRPVVPSTCTLPALATNSAWITLAAGMVKSTSPSAPASSGAGSVVTVTPFVPSPASSPASRPIAAEPGASTAPASADAVGRGNGVDQRAPHAPARARHDQPHVGHDLLSDGRGYSGATTAMEGDSGRRTAALTERDSAQPFDDNSSLPIATEASRARWP